MITSAALTVLFALVSLFYLVVAWRMTRGVLNLLKLPPPVGGEPAKVSVVLAARDEQAGIEEVVRRLLTQAGVELEVIAVSDRSADGTPAILRRLADEDGRVRPVILDALPSGWLGKCHACHQGSLVASGDWLLFTDADIHLGPDVIARAMQLAQREGVQHVCMLFNPRSGTAAGRAAQLVFFLAALAGASCGVNRDRPGASAGIGAFNLVRASAYRASGGHEALRLTVLEDVRLGLLLRRAGSRTRLLHGGEEVTADWSATPGALVKLLEKNLFSATGYSPARAASGVCLHAGFWALALAGPWTGTVAGYAAAAGLALLAVPALLLARRAGGPLLPALMVPLLWPILPVALGNSAWKTLRQGGVRWRDTFYPLDVLREGNVR